VVCREPEIQTRHLPPEVREGAVPGDTFSSSGPDPAAGRTDFSRDEIVEVLEQTDWNVAKSARKLGVARNTLYLKMKTLGLKRPENV
jgi:transcriptional regulator of acetoin/glycerol metabolism